MSPENYFYFTITALALALILMVVGMLSDKDGFTVAGGFAVLVILGAPLVLRWLS